MKKDLTEQVDQFAELLMSKNVLNGVDLASYDTTVEVDWTARNGAALCARAWID